MESQIKMVIIGMIIIGLGMGIVVEVGEGARAPVLHEVGGNRFGWRLNVNLSNWAANQRFYVGDWLYFGFDKQKISVLEVNQTGYENCVENNYITNITRGGRDVFNLTVARPYYFISGRGYCFRGIKLAITVQDAPLLPALPPDDFSATNPSTTLITSAAATTTTTTTSTSYYKWFNHFLITIIIVSIANYSAFC
ncbi:early nodulin-like protein 20 [Spinacia oleracea]|uniref:Early nodulin-like protein 20 n=1 Tax=Spinacia oleracea TaxID=3562 RepID=A0A9R0JY96_SPIOL|nr:early nodulin-like protein 20 [Spinacia oleracea]